MIAVCWASGLIQIMHECPEGAVQVSPPDMHYDREELHEALRKSAAMCGGCGAFSAPGAHNAGTGTPEAMDALIAWQPKFHAALEEGA